uniref:BL1S6 n=1 Tax=Meloidogyne hapla TaxID=6305 RepID=A0A1I8BX38_MELHA
MHNAGSSQQGQQTEEDEGSGTGEDIVAKTKELFQLLKDVNSLVSKYGSDDEINHVIDLTYSYVKEQNKLTAIMEEGKDTLDAELQYREQIQNIRDHPEQYHVDLKELVSSYI